MKWPYLHRKIYITGSKTAKTNDMVAHNATIHTVHTKLTSIRASQADWRCWWFVFFARHFNWNALLFWFPVNQSEFWFEPRFLLLLETIDFLLLLLLAPLCVWFGVERRRYIEYGGCLFSRWPPLLKNRNTQAIGLKAFSNYKPTVWYTPKWMCIILRIYRFAHGSLFYGLSCVCVSVCVHFHLANVFPYDFQV